MNVYEKRLIIYRLTKVSSVNVVETPPTKVLGRSKNVSWDRKRLCFFVTLKVRPTCFYE